MKSRYFINLLLIFGIFFCHVNEAIASNSLFEEGNQYVKAEIIIDREPIPSHGSGTSTFPRIGVLFSIKPGWHIYWQNSGQSGTPTQVQWLLPDNYKVTSLRYPAPFIFDEVGGIITYGYQKKALLISTLILPETAVPQSSLNIKAQVKFLACNRVCLPGRYNLERTFSTSQQNIDQPSKHYKLFDSFDNTTPRTTTLTVQSTLKSALPSSSYHLLIDVNQIPHRKNFLPQQIQIFPYKIEGARYGNPYLTKLDASGKQYVILPVSIEPSISSMEQLFAGIIVISHEVLQSDFDYSYEWSYQQKLGPELANDRLSELVENQTIADTKLSYRYAHPIISALHGIPQGITQNSSLIGFIIALAAGFLAGILLNVMPCVLPVLSIKILGFINRAQQTKLERLKSALFYTLGTITTFVGLALSVIVLKNIGGEIGWGFQFQHPSFVLALALIIFVLSLSLFDIYQFNVWGVERLTAYSNSTDNSYQRDFCEGILAAVLATPCSAPLLGSALAFAFASSATIIIAVFIAIGLGLAFPFVVLSSNQKFLSYLPKPGLWMIYLKRILGVCLLGTSAWLIFVLDALTSNSIYWALLLMALVFTVVISLKLLNKKNRSKLINPLVTLVTLGCIMFIWPYATTERSLSIEGSKNEKINWQLYSEELIKDLATKSQPVFIVFTAQWCLTCKYNESFVIDTDEVSELIKQKNIVPIKADWTTGDENISKGLKMFGGRWVPYYVAIPTTKTPLQTPGPLLTKSKLLQVLSNL